MEKKELVTKLEKCDEKKSWFTLPETSLELSTVKKTGAARDLHCAKSDQKLKGGVKGGMMVFCGTGVVSTDRRKPCSRD